MHPAVFLALPLMLPLHDSVVDTRVDIMAAPTVQSIPADRLATLASKRPLIPPLYAPPDGGFSVSLSPGGPCTAACLRLQVRF